MMAKNKYYAGLQCQKKNLEYRVMIVLITEYDGNL